MRRSDFRENVSHRGKKEEGKKEVIAHPLNTDGRQERSFRIGKPNFPNSPFQGKEDAPVSKRREEK